MPWWYTWKNVSQGLTYTMAFENTLREVLKYKYNITYLAEYLFEDKYGMLVDTLEYICIGKSWYKVECRKVNYSIVTDLKYVNKIPNQAVITNFEDRDKLDFDVRYELYEGENLNKEYDGVT